MVDKSRISKITLGTAQLGLHYGINSVGQPTEDEAFEILKYAFANGLRAIDTSPIYGDSEKRIGKFIKEISNQEIFVITKLEAQEFPEEIWDNRKTLSKRIDKEFKLSRINLNLRRIPVYILHYAEQAFKNNGMVLDKLVEMRKRGYIRFTGTSLYTGEELERCIDDERIDVVQIPFSILDRRLMESGLLNKAYKKGLIIFARSVFLQGLVFMDRLPIGLSNARETISGLHYLTNRYDMSIAELCLRYALSVNEISSVVVGADSLKQMKENIESIKIASLSPFRKDILKEIGKLSQMPNELIDIRSWSPSYNFTRN